MIETRDWLALFALILGLVNLGWNVYVFRRGQPIGRNMEQYKAKLQIKVKRADAFRDLALAIGSVRMDRFMVDYYHHPDTRGGLPDGYRDRIPELYLSPAVKEAIRLSKVEFSVYERQHFDNCINRLTANEQIHPIDDADGWLTSNFIRRVLDYEAKQHRIIDDFASFLRDTANRTEASLRGETDV